MNAAANNPCHFQSAGAIIDERTSPGPGRSSIIVANTEFFSQDSSSPRVIERTIESIGSECDIISSDGFEIIHDEISPPDI